MNIASHVQKHQSKMRKRAQSLSRMPSTVSITPIQTSNSMVATLGTKPLYGQNIGSMNTKYEPKSTRSLPSLRSKTLLSESEFLEQTKQQLLSSFLESTTVTTFGVPSGLQPNHYYHQYRRRRLSAPEQASLRKQFPNGLIQRWSSGRLKKTKRKARKCRKLKDDLEKKDGDSFDEDEIDDNKEEWDLDKLSNFIKDKRRLKNDYYDDDHYGDDEVSSYDDDHNNNSNVEVHRN